ncbi:MerR family transcriptional regulator [Rhodococcus sp. NPDC058532]|uniref:MerR family transcriptional regulator n=1 Tax=Rhodococcus sp. NPDC058532 TaxID=3346540 RepID=UPI0036626A84
MAEHPVGRVAAMSGTSVRTLHHYDRIGLLTPHARTAAGHRRYTDTDLARLRRILYYRALDFPLDEIAALLDDPDPDAHLRRQHRLLRQRRARIAALLTELEREIEARGRGVALSAAEQLEIFGTERFADLVAAARGAGDDWRAISVYGSADWREIKAEAERLIAEFAEAIAAGEPATGDRATAAAEAHRRHLERWFHDCDPERHVTVAEQYVADPRAIAEWDAVAPGYARYVHDAIVANARRQSTS